MPSELEEVCRCLNAPRVKEPLLTFSDPSLSNSCIMEIRKYDKLACPPKKCSLTVRYDANTKLACEHLVGYSTSQPSLFKKDQLLPVRDLKLLARDYTVTIDCIGFWDIQVLMNTFGP